MEAWLEDEGGGGGGGEGEETVCPLCFCEVDDAYELVACGHVFCRECLEGQFQGAHLQVSAAFKFATSRLYALGRGTRLKGPGTKRLIIGLRGPAGGGATAAAALHCRGLRRGGEPSPPHPKPQRNLIDP